MPTPAVAAGQARLQKAIRHLKKAKALVEDCALNSLVEGHLRERQRVIDILKARMDRLPPDSLTRVELRRAMYEVDPILAAAAQESDG